MKAGRIVIVIAFLLAGGAAAWWFYGRPEQQALRFQGYVEGYLVYVAPEESGRIEELGVASGSRVAKNQPLFALDDALATAQRDEAAARLEQAKAQLANLQAALQRPEQIAVLRAQEERAQAQLELSQAELNRQRTLFERGIAARAQLDQARTAFERDKAALAEVQRQIKAGQISGRSAEIDAAEAAVRVAEAVLQQADTRLAKRRVKASGDSQVQDIYFRPGEMVNAGQPVLALLPDGNRRIRFYVPEPLLATMGLGTTIGITCDSCPAGLQARVSFVSREAEYTPPVIFSEEERSKLVFRVEAEPLNGADLPIGLPVSVIPPEWERAS